jgi:hypothetical protein
VFHRSPGSSRGSWRDGRAGIAAAGLTPREDAAGIGSIAVGMIQAQVGESTGISRVASIVFPTIITVWVATLGVLLLRRAARLDSSFIEAGFRHAQGATTS